MKNFTRLLFVLLALIPLCEQLIAQNTCASPTIISSIPFSSGSQTTCGTVGDYAAGTLCNLDYGAGEDYVYEMVVSTAPVTYTIALGGTAAWKIASVHSACPPTNGNAVGCVTTSSGTTGSANITFSTTGTYYIIIDTWPTPTCGNFTLSITVPPPPPANDDCAGATSLTVGTGFPCAPSNPFSWVGATASAVTAPTCGTYSTGDIWYTFTLASDQTVMINTAAGTGGTPITDGAMSLYSGTCGALTEVECDDDDGAGSMPQIRRFLTAGTYYIRFWDYDDKVTTNFGGICVTAITPLANDNCSGVNGTPIVLTPQPFAASCSAPVSATTVGGTQSNTDCAPGGTFAADDVWFQFTTGAGITSQTIRFQNVVTVFGGSVTSMALNTYTSCAGASANCNTSVTLTAGAGQVTLTGLTATTTYYLRVWTNGDTDNGATFDICVIDPQPMTYVSSAITQQTGSTGAGTSFNRILRLNVVTLNLLNPLTVTQLDFSTTGTSLPADITNARVYYTGATSTWTDGGSSGIQFGSTIVNPSGTMTFTGSQALTGGVANTNNYFWLVYDLACGASGPNLDASMLTNGLTMAGGPYTPTTPDPASNRTVTALAAFNTVANGNWNNPSTWACGVPPNNTTAAININHNVTLDVDASVQSTVTVAATRTLTVNTNTLTIGGDGTGTQNLVINGTVAVGGGTLNVGTAGSGTVASGSITFASGGLLNVTAGTLNVGTGLIANVTTGNITVAAGATMTVSGSGTVNLGPTGGYNRVLSVTGTFTNSGAVNVNGNAVFNSSSTFNMSGGTLTIDGNGAASVASATNLLRFGSLSTGVTINGTGGTITIVDPHATSSLTNLAVGISISSSNVPTTSFAGTTFQFGDGVSTTAGNTSGFVFDTYLSTKNVPLGPVIVNGGSGATRFTAGTSATGNASDIFGSLTVNAGSEIRTLSSGGIGVYGNIVNDGTISITSVSSGVLFLGGRQLGSAPAANQAQTISGSGVWRNNTTSASATASINSLTMNNSGGTTLQVPLSVGNTLTLTTGRITTSAANYLAVGTGVLPEGGVSTIGTSTISGGSSTSHIVGPIYRTVPAATTWLIADQRGLFPVGDGAIYRPINVAVTTNVGTAGPLSGEHKSTDPGVPASPYADGGINIVTTSPTGFWNVSYASSGISPFNTTAGGVYTVQCNATGFTKRPSGAITDLAGIRLIKRPTDGSWVSGADGTASAPTLITAVSRSGCTTFSDFAIGGTTTALPIELKSFTGKSLKASNQLEWITSTEEGVKEHIIERSANGYNNWILVGTTPSKGDARVDQSYSMEDKTPLTKSFYRLRTLDFDGREQFSNVISLTRQNNSFGVIAAYPNPAVDMINVQFNTLEEGNITARIVDMTGRLVLEQQMSALNGTNMFPVQLHSLSAGTYFITLSSDREVAEPIRFVKQ